MNTPINTDTALSTLAHTRALRKHSADKTRPCNKLTLGSMGQSVSIN